MKQIFFKRGLLVPVGALIILGVGFWFWRAQADGPRYVTAAIAKGNIVRSVAASGTLNPVTTVQVGSYVSGTIQSLACDYNTKVTAGQLCAKVDPRPYQVVVDQSEANLASAQAQLQKDRASLAYAKTNYERDQKLRKQGIVSQDVLDSDKSTVDQAVAQVAIDEATIKQRQSALEAARVNLDYTNIVSPVEGVVISRSIDVGQTVAASFQTPTLFLIAKDMTKMQVDTNVSESDVGGIKEGQKAYFTVEAYPDKQFWGQVTQVRQAPITVQNVVTYDVVIGVENPELQLLPGMTANVRVIIDTHENVLQVPLAALRYTPRGGERKHAANGEQQGQEKHVPKPHVWLLQDGKPKRVPVVTGLSDGTSTEVTADALQAGQPIIVKEAEAAATARPTSASSPLARGGPRF